MLVECTKCTIDTPAKNITVDYIQPDEPRSDGISHELHIYHPAHNIKAYIDGIGHEFSLAELLLLGRGDYTNALNRIYSACSSVEVDLKVDRNIQNYFIRQKQLREKIYIHIQKSYTNNPQSEVK